MITAVNNEVSHNSLLIHPTNSIKPPPPLKELQDEYPSGQSVHVLRDYFSAGCGEISVFIDDKLELLDDSDTYWFLLRDKRSGQIGYVPGHLVRTDDELLAVTNSVQNKKIAVPAVALRGDKKASEGHKKVNFSKSEATIHTFEPEDTDEEYYSELWKIKFDDSDDEMMSKFSLKDSSFFTDSTIDAAIKESFERDPPMPSVQNNGITPFESSSSFDPSMLSSLSLDSVEDEEICTSPNLSELSSSSSTITEQQGNGMIKGLFSKIWKRQTDGNQDEEQMIRIYSGNFKAESSYKTCMMKESETMTRLHDKAVNLFKMHENDRTGYELSLAHVITHQVIPLRPTVTVGSAIELAKLATIEEGDVLDHKGKPVKRHRKKLPKEHLELLKRRSSSPQQGFFDDNADVSRIRRDKKSDFPTHYKFILNLKIQPDSTNIFFIKVDITWDSTISLNEDVDDLQITMPVTGLTTVDQVTELALAAMEICKMPGINYQMVIKDISSLGSHRLSIGDRTVLPGEMLIYDVFSYWPVQDASGVRFSLQPIVDLEGANQ